MLMVVVCRWEYYLLIFITFSQFFCVTFQSVKTNKTPKAKATQAKINKGDHIN